MHLVIGAGEFLGDLVSRTLATEVPLIELARIQTRKRCAMR